MRSVLSLSVAVLLSACAYSPQRVQLQPTVKVAGPALGNDRAVAITVDDARPSHVVGSRGGVYAATATITVDDEVTDAIRTTVAKAFGQLGFKVADTAQRKLDITLRQLSYSKRNGMLDQVTVTCKVAVRADRGAEHYTSEYTTEHSQQVVTTPGADANREFLNKALSQSLQRLVNDRQLTSFLAATTPNTAPGTASGNTPAVATPLTN